MGDSEDEGDMQLSEGSGDGDDSICLGSDAESDHISLGGSTCSDVPRLEIATGSRVPGQFDLERNSITRFGCFTAARGLCSLDDALLLKAEPLGITLEQVADGSGPKHARLSGLVPAGEEPTLVVYGTLRCCKVTHYAAEVLTRRGKLELPSCLHFDPVSVTIAT